MTNNLFNPNDRVIFTPENKIYTFGRYLGKNSCIIYEENDIKKQEIFEVQIKDLIKYDKNSN